MKILIIHLLISIVASIFCYKDEGKHEFILKCLILIMFPVGGILLVVLLTFRQKKYISSIEEDYENEQILLFTDSVLVNNYKDIVPIEESLIINKDKIKRQQIIEQLKKDSLNYIDVLKKAVRDDDVETSHYASSAIVEIKRKLELDIQRFSVEYEKNKESVDFLKNYSEVLKNYISSNLLDKYSLKKYTYTYIKVLEELLKLREDKNNYKELIQVLIKNNELEKAQKYSKDFLESIPSEEAYIEKLRLLYTIRDLDNFKRIFNELLNSSIELSPKGIELVRAWVTLGGTNGT